jgi:hypothetical protein
VARHRTRYDKNALTFLGGVTLAALITYHRGMKDSVVEAFTFGVVTELWSDSVLVGFCTVYPHRMVRRRELHDWWAEWVASGN